MPLPQTVSVVGINTKTIRRKSRDTIWRVPGTELEQWSQVSLCHSCVQPQSVLLLLPPPPCPPPPSPVSQGGIKGCHYDGTCLKLKSDSLCSPWKTMGAACCCPWKNLDCCVLFCKKRKKKKKKNMMDHCSFLNLRRGTVPRCSDTVWATVPFFFFFFKSPFTA